jgi:hypothetical protein
VGGKAGRGPEPLEVLGEVTAPSGRLAVFDIGMFNMLSREQLEPMLIVADGLPRDRPLRVVGQRMGSGKFADCWAWFGVELATGTPRMGKALGEAVVDFARLVFIDHAAIDAWEHDKTLDGKADFVFWGGDDVPKLAKAAEAPELDDGQYGWIDLPIEEARTYGLRVEAIKQERGWRAGTDFRPHSHHYLALREARDSATGSGTITVGGARVCLAFTSWGDGVFPVHLDQGDGGEKLRVRVQLQTPASLAAMHAVNA